MAALAFVWDASTARSNAKKHGVSLDEAQSAFSDERARIIDDPDHSGDDDRFIFLGMGSKPRVLVVVYAYRDREATIGSSRLARPRHRSGALQPEGEIMRGSTTSRVRDPIPLPNGSSGRLRSGSMRRRSRIPVSWQQRLVSATRRSSIPTSRPKRLETRLGRISGSYKS